MKVTPLFSWNKQAFILFMFLLWFLEKRPPIKSRDVEDELHGHNPHRLSVVATSPNVSDTGLRIVMKRRIESTSKTNSALLTATSRTSDIPAMMSAQINVDLINRGLEITDLLGRSRAMQMTKESEQRDAFVAECRTHLQAMTDKLFVVYGISGNDEVICKGR